MDGGWIEDVILVSDLSGPPLRFRHAIIDVGQAGAGSRIIVNRGNAVGDGHGCQARCSRRMSGCVKGGVPLADPIFVEERLAVLNSTVAWNMTGGRDVWALILAGTLKRRPLRMIH